MSAVAFLRRQTAFTLKVFFAPIYGAELAVRKAIKERDEARRAASQQTLVQASPFVNENTFYPHTATAQPSVTSADVKPESEIETPMGFAKTEAEIAARLSAFIKAELERAEMTYAQLARELRKHGHPDETAESIKQKLKRGTFPATFLLATVAALGLESVDLDSV